MSRFIAASILAIATALLVGCDSPGPGAYDIVVTLDPAFKPAGTQAFPPVTCQVVGAANKAERDLLLSTSVNSQIGRSAADLKSANVLTFDPASSPGGSVTVSKTNPMWATWKMPQFIIVTANIPDAKVPPGATVNDPRRVWFSTNKLRWTQAEGTIKFRITRERIMKETAETPLKPDQVGPDEF